MIYRIHSNIKDFDLLHLVGKKARKALGEDTDFYMDERPIAYAKQWQPMEVDFVIPTNVKKKSDKPLPDLSLNVEKLFLSAKAYELLKDELYEFGELLPVTVADAKADLNQGYIFNCLTVKEIDEKLSVHDPLNDRFSMVFTDTDKTNTVFKTKLATNLIDGNSLFCTQAIKDIVEANQLTGINFSIDTGNPFPEELGMKKTH